MGSFRQATKNDVNEMAELASSSFAGHYQAFFKNSFKDSQESTKFWTKLYSIYIKASMRKAVCYIDVQKGVIASFCMFSPIENKISTWDYITVGGASMFTYFFKKGLMQFMDFQKVNLPFNSDKNLDKVWYVNILAVSPNYQGKQLGSKMINDCVSPYVKQHNGKGIALVTNTDKGYQFYTKNNFIVTAHDKFSYSGHTFDKWSFFKSVV